MQSQIDTTDNEKVSTDLNPDQPKQMITQNLKGQLRRVVHRMTVGESNAEVFCAKFDPEDKYLACGYGDGVIRIFNMETGKMSFSLQGGGALGANDDMPVTSIKWRPQSSQLKTMNVLVSAQADGSLKHWHATSGKCLHSRNDNPENHLFTLDYNVEGTLLAAAGRDYHIRIYDETTKSLSMTLKDRGEWPGHSNRIFCVKFNPLDSRMLISGGWDHTLQIYDLRLKGPVQSIYGPHICGETIDFRFDGWTVLTGSYRQEDPIQLWDLRTYKCIRSIDWEGTNSSNSFITENEETQISSNNNRKSPAMLYATMFNRKQDLILAGGAGANEVRIFDYETGNIVCKISQLEKSVMCMDISRGSNANNSFAFGSADSCVRVMDIVS